MTTYCTRCGVMTGDLSGSGQCAECDALDQRPVVTYSRPGTGLPDISLCARCARSYDGALGAVQHGPHRGYCGGEDHDASSAAATLGRRGGQQRTQAQAAARRANGARGGRPKLYSVTWRLPFGRPIAEDLGLPARASLPRTIAECRRIGTAADLRDRTGALAGRVEADGSYRLG